MKKDICKRHGIPFSTLSTILAYKRSKVKQASQGPFHKKENEKDMVTTSAQYGCSIIRVNLNGKIKPIC